MKKIFWPSSMANGSFRLLGTNLSGHLLRRRWVHMSTPVIVRDSSKKIRAIIIQTANDEKPLESRSNYLERSWPELAKQIPKDMLGKDLLLLKIDQCVIDPQKWEEGKIIKTFFTGHVIAGLIQASNSIITLIDNSLISKVKKGLESELDIKERRIFTEKAEWERGWRQGSHEYLFIVSLDMLNLNRQQFIERCDKIKKNPGKFDLTDSACGQKIYELITGKNIGSYRSPQAATARAILDTLSEDDDVLKNNLYNSLINSGLSMAAYDLGKKYLQSQSSIENITDDSTSDYQPGRP